MGFGNIQSKDLASYQFIQRTTIWVDWGMMFGSFHRIDSCDAILELESLIALPRSALAITEW